MDRPGAAGRVATRRRSRRRSPCRDDPADWIPDALYGTDPRRFQPGPIARQVPVLRRAFGLGLRLLTTNYDDLLQQAFEDAGIGVEAAAFTGPEGSSAPATDAA